MKFTKFLSAAFILSAIAVTSCKKDDVTTPETPATIATTESFSDMAVVVKESGTSNGIVYRKANPTDTSAIVLKHGKAYDVSVMVYDRSSKAPVNISSIATKERFYYTPSASSSITVIGLNTDSTNLPIGNTSKWITEVTGAGSINIIVKSYPDNKSKSADDTANDNKAATAIDVTFNTRVI